MLKPMGMTRARKVAHDTKASDSPAWISAKIKKSHHNHRCPIPQFSTPYINRGTFFEECECRSTPYRSSSFMVKYCIQNSGAQRLHMLRMAFGPAISVHQTPEKAA